MDRKAKRLKLENVDELKTPNSNSQVSKISLTETPGAGDCFPSTNGFELEKSDFKDVVEKDYYIDKSLFIKEIIKNTCKYLLITAPHGSGKTTNLTMLKRFFEIQIKRGKTVERESSINYQLFKKLDVFQDDDLFNTNFGEYPVIYVNFNRVTGTSYQQVFSNYRLLLHETFKQFPYLLQSKELSKRQRQYVNRFVNERNYKILHHLDLINGLRVLGNYLYKHFKSTKVFMLIDNLFSLFNKMIMNEEIISFLNEIYKATFQQGCSCYLKKAILTDVSYYCEGLDDPFNLIRIFYFQDSSPFNTYFNLTKFELASLLRKYKITKEIQTRVMSYYGPYMTKDGVQLFHLSSILSFLNTRKIENFWQQSSGGIVDFDRNLLKIPIMRYFIRRFSLKEHQTLYNNDRFLIIIKTLLTSTDQNSFYSQHSYLFFLLNEGYLTYQKWVERDKYIVKAVNEEICDEFKYHLNVYEQKTYPSITRNIQKCADAFNKFTIDCEHEIFENFLLEFNQLLRSYQIGTKTVVNYHVLLFDILCKTDFSFNPCVALEDGHTNLIFYKDNLGVFVIVKFKECSDVALNEILQDYAETFKDPHFEKAINHEMLIGLNVNGDCTANMSIAYIDSQNLDNSERIWV